MKRVLSLVSCLSLLVLVTGCGSDNDKLKDYLDEHGFTCNEGTSLSDFGYTCTKGDAIQEIFEIEDGSNVTYTVKRG